MSNFKKFISNNILPICGVVLIFISTMITWGNVIDFKVNEAGLLVNANVIEAPSNCDKVSSRGGFCTLEYNGRKYITKAGKKFCYLVSGKSSVQMITDYEGTKLLFPNEFTNFEFATGFILMTLGLFITFKKFIPFFNKKDRMSD